MIKQLVLGALLLFGCSGAESAESVQCEGPIPGSAFSSGGIARLEEVHAEWTAAAVAFGELPRPDDTADEAAEAAVQARREEQRTQILALEARFREECTGSEQLLRSEARRFAHGQDEPVAGWAQDAATNFFIACNDRNYSLGDTVQQRSARFTAAVERARARFADPCSAPPPMSAEESQRFLRAIED